MNHEISFPASLPRAYGGLQDDRTDRQHCGWDRRRSGATSAPPRPVALAIGGTDGCGCAGVQVDLRVLARLGLHGAAVIAAVTAQTPTGVIHVEPV